MIKKLATVIMSVLIGMTCSACQTTSPQPYGSIRFQVDRFGGIFQTEVNQPFGIFHSQEEVKTFFDNCDIIWDNLPVWEKYSNDFLKENILIFYSSWQSDQSIKRSIHNVYINQNTLMLDIVGEVPESKMHDGKIDVNNDAIFLTFIIEVNQMDVLDISKVNAEFRFKIIKL